MEEHFYLASAHCTRIDVVYCCDGKLTQATNSQASHQEHSTSPNFRNYAAVRADGNNSDRNQDTAVHEWATDLCHLEEVCAVSYHKHSTRRGLSRYGGDGKERTTAIDWVSPDVHEVRAVFCSFLRIDCSLNLRKFRRHDTMVRTKPQHCFACLLGLVHEHKPSGRFGDEEQADGDDHWDEVDSGQRYDVGVSTFDVVCGVVDYGTDERANRRPYLKY